MRDAKILIVEDEILIALDIKSKVENFGYRVVGMVNSGQKALDKIRSLQPDLVLMDIVLFGNMDGIEAAKAIHTQYHIPVVYLTAHADDQTLERAMATEPFGYVVKPLKDRELLGAIEIALFKYRLEQSQKNWQNTFNAMLDWVCLVETDTMHIVQTNIQGESLLEKSISEIAGQDCCRLVHHSDKPVEGCPVQKMLITRKRETFEFWDPLRKKWFMVTADPVADASGTIQSAVHIVRDITALKNGETQLRSERDKFQSILAAIGEGMAIVDDVYTVEYQNDISKQTLGNGVGKPCHESLMQNRNVCNGCLLGSAIQSGRIESFEKNLQDGRCFEITVSPFTDVDGRKKAVLLQKDITGKKALQIEAVRAAHLQSMGELAAGVAHEINNPIMGIINCAQLIADGKPADRDNREIPKRIINEGERIAKIVKNLLAFARNNKDEKSPVGVSDVLNDTLGLIGNQLRKDTIAIRVDLPGNLPDILANRYQIQQVFLNLLSNAGYALNERYPKANPDKIIEIRCSKIKTKGTSMVRTEFIDHGTGIPVSILGRVCDPFFTTKRTEGTGLGLSICHNIIREHGGNLHLESEEGQFTKITVELPANGERA